MTSILTWALPFPLHGSSLSLGMTTYSVLSPCLDALGSLLWPAFHSKLLPMEVLDICGLISCPSAESSFFPCLCSDTHLVSLGLNCGKREGAGHHPWSHRHCIFQSGTLAAWHTEESVWARQVTCSEN